MRDLTAELEGARRRVGAAEVPAGHGHLVELRRVYDARVEDVWAACTEPERVSRWFVPVSGDLRLGGHYQIQGNASGEITECRPPHRLALTWVFGADVSLLTVDLTPLGDEKAELRLGHAVTDNDHWAQYGPGATGVGWDLTLLGLDTYLQTGEPLGDPETVQSDPAVLAFVRQSALEWGAAHRAAGASATTADEAAARTSAAYAPGP